MKKNENRRQFIQKFGLMSIAAHKSNFLSTNPFNLFETESRQGKFEELISFSPSNLFSVLDLDLPQLENVKKALQKKGYNAALTALLNYYRKCYPKPEMIKKTSFNEWELRTIERANNLVKHIFQWGPYAPANYGPDIDWSADPAGDIEWVAGVYRFAWANDLGNAYKLTGNDQYVQTFIDLTSDWIKKHPLEKTLDNTHPVYSNWRGYAWLDLQTGIRATNICSNFRLFVNSKAFTPQFLGVLLASLFDHQIKTEKMPMGMVHNKAIFEQRGFINVIHTFPEFKDKNRWLDISIAITSENLLAQTTADGVQREWCGGYHSGVYSDALEIEGRIRDLGYNMPDYYVNRIKLMAEHIFGISTPDLGFPMFGDTAREKIQSKDRKTWGLYKTLEVAGQRFGDPKFQALADLDKKHLPENGSVAFSEAGLYAMRNGWSTDDIYMALHCSPPAFSSHDTADNGTFELFAYGRWLMPDTGYFTYGHDPEARAWHRQTKVHPTLTVNGKDTNIIGRHLLWKSDVNEDLVCFENHSYLYLLHRRTVWFTNKKEALPFFVILDEAIGHQKGDIELHFPMAPGKINIDNKEGKITTDFEDSNLLIKIKGKQTLNLFSEEGWTAWSYGKREKRLSVTAQNKGTGPLSFITVLVPYRGKNIPECKILTDVTKLYAGKNPVEIIVEVEGKSCKLQRNLMS